VWLECLGHASLPPKWLDCSADDEAGPSRASGFDHRRLRSRSNNSRRVLATRRSQTRERPGRERIRLTAIDIQEPTTGLSASLPRRPPLVPKEDLPAADGRPRRLRTSSRTYACDTSLSRAVSTHATASLSRMLNAGRSGQTSVDCEPAVRLAARPDAQRIDWMFDRFRCVDGVAHRHTRFALRRCRV
jgi:hypothetical protein